MKIYKKPLWMCLALVIYVTGMAIYFIPRNHEMSSTEKVQRFSQRIKLPPACQRLHTQA